MTAMTETEEKAWTRGHRAAWAELLSRCLTELGYGPTEPVGLVDACRRSGRDRAAERGGRVRGLPHRGRACAVARGREAMTTEEERAIEEQTADRIARRVLQIREACSRAGVPPELYAVAVIADALQDVAGELSHVAACMPEDYDANGLTTPPDGADPRGSLS